MTIALASLACGLIFGWGLLISGMANPAKVLAFLDLAGRWDASLAVTMASALLVTSAGFALTKRRQKPVFTPKALWPSRKDIDSSLLAGALLFGLGWGLAGLCPGPAIENLATLSPRVIVFVAAMAAGMALHDLWQRWRVIRLSGIRSAARITR
jgi:hypothetical protein